jgi:hypothetical protein
VFKNIPLRKSKIEYFIAIAIILLFHLPLIIMGQNGYVMVDDVLNLEFLYKHLLKVNGMLFELNPYLAIPNIYPDGLSLGYIHSRFNIIDLLFFLFNSFDAYVINSILVRIIAFFSMYNLINQSYSSIGKTNTFFISIAFSLTPINSIYGLTSIGLPIVFIAFNNLINNKKLGLSLLLILLYVTYSTPLTYPFITFYLIIIIVYHFIYKKITKNILFFLYGILFFVFSILITDYSLISFSSSDSHRALRVIFETPTPSLLGITYGMIKYTLLGSYHPSLFIPISIIILVVLNFKKINKKLLIILSLILINRLVDLLRPFIENTVGDYFQIIKVFDIGRLTWLNPFLFYLALILIIKILVDRNISKTFIIIILIFQSFTNIIRSPEFTFNLMDNRLAGNYFFNDDILVKNLQLFRSNPTDINWLSSLNYNEFFSEDLFDKIKSNIGLPQNEYRVIGYGIDPSVLIFNGFYTLDGYTSNHSKDYHLTFNKIQPTNNIYASHNLLLVNDFCRHCSIDKGSYSISKLELDYEIIKKLKGKYLISGINILNDDNLDFQKSFENSFYKIYLYKIK